jgi:hypothetical protein
MKNIDESYFNLAILKGVSFLHSSQLSYGEFDMCISTKSSMNESNSCLASSPYITTFVLNSISFVEKSHLVHEIVDKSVRFLSASMEKHGTWRFYSENNRKTIYRNGNFTTINMGIVPDLDDTACASYSLMSNKVIFPDNHELLYRYRTPEGSFKTWIIDEKDLIRKNDYIPPLNSVCCGVNANILMYLGDNLKTEKTSDYINRIILYDKEAEGNCYFPDIMVLYYLITRAYSKGVSSLESSRKAIASKISHHIRYDPCYSDIGAIIFAVAALLNIDQFADDHTKWIYDILEAQDADGSWPITSFFVDASNNHYGAKELTTAIALEAVSKFIMIAN